jgi:hypothetical protein
MINYRVQNLEALLDRLKSAGVIIVDDVVVVLVGTTTQHARKIRGPWRRICSLRAGCVVQGFVFRQKSASQDG